MQAIETMLRDVAGFTELESKELRHIASFGDVDRWREGSVLFRQGSNPEALYVLLEGHVALTGAARDQASTVIDIVRPTSSFVLTNVLAEDPYQMGAETVADSSLLRIEAEPLRALIASRPEAARAMLRAVSQELGAITQQVVDLKRQVTAERLSAYLLTLVADERASKASFRLPFSKGLLAAWLGCRAENLSRAFMTLRTYGVETHGSRVTLHNIDSLRSYAGVWMSPRTRQPVEQVFGDAFRLRAQEG
jgi:CRP-like cAMP-binding protein